MRRFAGPFQEDDVTHEANASHASAQNVLLPADGSSGRPIGRGVHTSAGGSRGTSVSATASFRSGRVVVNERVVQLAKQLAASGVPLELATTRAEVQVYCIFMATSNFATVLSC
jgi:hypothetical protein